MSAIESSSTSSSVALSSDSDINSLVFGTRWGGALGTPVTITYSFPTDSGAFNFTNTGQFANLTALGGPAAQPVNVAWGYWDFNVYDTTTLTNAFESNPGNNPHGLNATQQTQFQAALGTW